MITAYKIHRTICFIVNVLIVGLITYAVKSDSSDKSPIILMVFYPLLFIVNLIMIIILWLLKSTHVKIYKQAPIVLMILFIPTLILTLN